MKGKTIERLEQALCFWEDNCFLIAAAAKMKLGIGMQPNYPLTGPLVYFAEFRNYLMNFRKGKIDFEKFVGPQFMDKLTGSFYLLPAALLSWTASSRRVFHMPSSFQVLFGETSFEDIRWNEIRWPFESFAITLENPISCSNGTECDCILVSEIGRFLPEVNLGNVKNYSGRMIEFRLLSTRLGEYRKITSADKEEAMRLIRKKKGEKIAKKFNTFQLSKKVDIPFDGGAFIILPDMVADKDITVSLSEISKFIYGTDKGALPEWNMVMHLILNLCVYLSNLPPKQFQDFYKPEQIRQKTHNGNFDSTAITDKSNVCTVGREHILSAEDQATIEEIKRAGSSKEKRAHWRRGHWRKVWGKKDDPISPRIWIKPCLVNKHRLAPGSLPSGSKTILTK